MRRKHSDHLWYLEISFMAGKVKVSRNKGGGGGELS